MSRLTRWNGKKWVLPAANQPGTWRSIADKLAQYEDVDQDPVALQKKLENRTGVWQEMIVESESAFFRRKFVCSACGDWNTYGRSRYCPDCGARMIESEV